MTLSLLLCVYHRPQLVVKALFFLIQIIRIWERQMRSPNLPLNKSKSNWATVPETRAVTSDQTVQTTVKRTQRPSWPLSAHLQQKHKPQPCTFFFFFFCPRLPLVGATTVTRWPQPILAGFFDCVKKPLCFRSVALRSFDVWWHWTLTSWTLWSY